MNTNNAKMDTYLLQKAHYLYRLTRNDRIYNLLYRLAYIKMCMQLEMKDLIIY